MVKTSIIICTHVQYKCVCIKFYYSQSENYDCRHRLDGFIGGDRTDAHLAEVIQIECEGILTLYNHNMCVVCVPSIEFKKKYIYGCLFFAYHTRNKQDNRMVLYGLYCL